MKLVSHSTVAATALSLLLLCAPARADDEEEPKPALVDPAAEGADATDEDPTVRKTTPEAEAAMERFGSLIHMPLHTGAKDLTVTASAEAAMFGGKLVVTPHWTPEGGLDLSVELPESLRAQYGDDGYEMFKSAATMLTREALAPAFEAPAQYGRDYNLSHLEANGEVVVTMLPFSERAAAERQTVTYDADGFVKSRIVVMKIDPETTDPMQQMLIGAELETTYTYEKRGKRSAITAMSSLTPVGELQVDYEYYELPDGSLLPRRAKLVTPFTPEPVDIAFERYELDGKVVPQTLPKDAAATTPKDEAGAGGADTEKSGAGDGGGTEDDVEKDDAGDSGGE